MCPSTNPSDGYVSFNQPLRRVCILQPTPPTGMCPSTNPSEGYVSFNQPLRVCILQPTLPREFGQLSKLVQMDAKIRPGLAGAGFFSLQPTLPRGTCPSTNPSEGYVSFNQPLRRVCGLQPTPPRGMCPSTNPSEGYVSFNEPLQGVCVLQPTPPSMYPSTNPSEGFEQFHIGSKRVQNDTKTDHLESGK